MSEIEKLNHELAILNRIAAALNRETDLNNALQVVLAQMAELLHLHTAWVWLMDEDEEAYLVAAQNLPPALATDPDQMMGTCYCLDTYREGDMEGAANVNVVTCSRLRHLIDGTDNLRYHASIPLYSQNRDKKLGVMNLASQDWCKLSADELRLLYTIGDLLGIAIERAQLFARSTQMGMIEERNRLAREIHDTLAQGLAGIALQLETADALLDAGADQARIQKVIQQALHLTRSHLDEARRSVLDLRAAPLEGRTLFQALEALAGGHIRLSASGTPRPLSIRIEVGLYRIAQEALSNINRHAQATHVTMQLVTHVDRVELIIQDDGSGFDPAQIPANRFGLMGMRERARLLGGLCTIESTPGTGTRIEVSVPL